jgi:hypothetical protein
VLQKNVVSPSGLKTDDSASQLEHQAYSQELKVMRKNKKMRQLEQKIALLELPLTG